MAAEVSSVADGVGKLSLFSFISFKQLSGDFSFPWLVTLKTEASSRPAVFNFFRQFSRRCDWKHLHLNRSQDCKDSISAKEISVGAVHRNHFYEDCNGNCL